MLGTWFCWPTLMSTPFSPILAGERPELIIAQTPLCCAFLDPSPRVLGHTLVVPWKAVSYIYDLDDALLAGMHLFAKQVALTLQAVVPCRRIGVAVIGLEVPHAHIHLIPLQSIQDMNFQAPKAVVDIHAQATLAASLRAHHQATHGA